MSVDISVVGIGYVGLVCGAGFAEMGNTVVCVDTDGEKIAALKKGTIPIYEPGLEEVVRENIRAGTLRFTTNLAEAVEETSICFIAVGTPMGEDGTADVRHVMEVAEGLGKHMNKHMFVVGKSTVPVGTSDRIRQCISAGLAARGKKISFDVLSNPEFLKEGMAVMDFMSPDRVVVGVDNAQSARVMRELYSPFLKNGDNFIVMDIRSAEMTKYAANAMLACKVSFINEIANICECVGADVNKVRVGIGSDSRIGFHFLYPGCGYGGSCLPKDVQALVRTSREHGYEPFLLEAIETVNEKQKRLLVEKVRNRFADRLNGAALAVWGLTFKPGTDDMREAPSIAVISRLVKSGAKIQVYDPKAMRIARELHFKDNPAITYFKSKYEAIKDADALLLLTEWQEFRSPDFDGMRKLMRQPIVFDGRNQYDSERMAELGFEYHQTGVSSCYPGTG